MTLRCITGYWVLLLSIQRGTHRYPYGVRVVSIYVFKGCRIKMCMVTLYTLDLTRGGPWPGSHALEEPALPCYSHSSLHGAWNPGCQGDMPPRIPVSPPPHYHAQGVGIPWLNGNCMSNSQGLPPNSRLCQLCVRLKHTGQQLAGRVWIFGLECLSVSLWGWGWEEKRGAIILSTRLR